MQIMTFARRFLIPGSFVSLWCLLRYGARVSGRSEVELAPALTLGRGTQISSFCKIKASAPLAIGSNTHVATGCFITAGPGTLEIGPDCLIGPNCVITTSEYRYSRLDVPLRLQGSVGKNTRIGRNVFIGANAVILGGASIGDNVVIAAATLVSGTVEAGGVVSGNPARVLFRRR
jgi:acetyltransferase-like isoleucine patch superfamily enzyme